jgi:hypothetical protein
MAGVSDHSPGTTPAISRLTTAPSAAILITKEKEVVAAVAPTAFVASNTVAAQAASVLLQSPAPTIHFDREVLVGGIEVAGAIPEKPLATGMVRAPLWEKIRNQYQVDPSDIVAAGILILAIAAAFVACVTVLGLVWGKVGEKTAAEIIISCVGGATLTGIASKLIVSKPKT